MMCVTVVSDVGKTNVRLQMNKLRLILGDQLNEQHSWFKSTDDTVYYVLMEVRSETDYVHHHIQKVVGIFAAMRSFAQALKEKGHHVIYIQLDDPENQQSFESNLSQLFEKYTIQQFEYQFPDEYRLDQHLTSFCIKQEIPCHAVDSEHFYTSRNEFSDIFKGSTSYLMERFYREMRIKHGVLLDSSNKPLGGKWNYDASNRKKMPKNHIPPKPFCLEHDVTALVELLEKMEVKTTGSLDANCFIWPINREEALDVLNYFCLHCLVHFGTFQDAMVQGMWSGYHSRLSFALNIKLISPQEVISKAVEAYEQNNSITIEQIEGFVRQILGWREYMRGIYWAEMPAFETLNYFEHKRALPDWFWTGNTHLNCLKDAIQQSLSKGYTHHIQRLMLTGNFCLLAGIDPDEIDFWYLSIYVDAFEWVEITNTRGMSQYADGGIVGTKPYVSSAAYIHKMSSYCDSCFYDYKKRLGERACPFNSLYWNFYLQHEEKLAKHPRIGMVYPQLNRMSTEEKEEIKIQAKKYINQINKL
jgi:deoxyribodipyrimidine photolyase-related protein